MYKRQGLVCGLALGLAEGWRLRRGWPALPQIPAGLLGEPGIGKSTLMLQLALRAQGLRTLYVSGEESARQIKMRAQMCIRDRRMASG